MISRNLDQGCTIGAAFSFVLPYPMSLVSVGFATVGVLTALSSSIVSKPDHVGGKSDARHAVSSRQSLPRRFAGACRLFRGMVKVFD